MNDDKRPYRQSEPGWVSPEQWSCRAPCAWTGDSLDAATRHMRECPDHTAYVSATVHSDQCEHPQATVNHQGIYTCPDCWHRVPTPSDSL